VKYFDWDDAKNAKLGKERGIGFEDIVFHIERGDLLDILEHPNPDRYARQRLFVIQREDYVYLVPFVEDEHMVFLKTIIPSRRATKPYVRSPTVKLDADEKELRAPSSAASGSPPRAAHASAPGTRATRRPRSARIGG
jgi:uncharacterized DUF497 family protein